MATLRSPSLAGVPIPDTIANPFLKMGGKSVTGAIRAVIDRLGILPKRFEGSFLPIRVVSEPWQAEERIRSKKRYDVTLSRAPCVTT